MIGSLHYSPIPGREAVICRHQGVQKVIGQTRPNLDVEISLEEIQKRINEMSERYVWLINNGGKGITSAIW